MKLNKMHLMRGREGTVGMTPEDCDDIWLLYNLIQPGDEVETVTFRKVALDSNSSSASGKDVTKKIRLVLSLEVSKVDADLTAPGLRVAGRNTKPTEHVKLGAHHTLDIEPDRSLKLTKPKWDRLSLQLIREASNPTGKCLVAAVVAQATVAHVCTIDQGVVKVRERLDGLSANDRRFAGSSKADANWEKYLERINESLDAHFDIARLKCLIIAAKEAELRDQLHARLLKKDKYREYKGKLLKLPASSGQPSALEALLKEPKVADVLADTKSAQDVKLMDTVHRMLQDNDEHRVCFGDYRHLMAAARRGAVKDLLLLDRIFR
jgi:protein pelota